ncbi:MAG: hypothetical protein J5879_10355, partial [Clostridia bacterium]|nr:hypothetical protein [Clostridia bacterium]
MKKRNLIADAFFEGVSAFSQQSGATGFDSRAEFSGSKKKGELLRMFCTARYENYDIEYVYTASGGLNLSSVFSFRVIFDRSFPYIKYSPYDLMYLIDDRDFRCYTFSCVESPERMRTVIKGLEPALYELLPKLDALCKNKVSMSDLFDKFSDNVNAFYGRDVFRADAEDDEFEHYLDSYYSLDTAFFASKPYAQFLRGDYDAAYNNMRRLKNKTFYQIRLMSFMATLDEKYDAVPPGCDTTGDAVYSNKTQFLRLFVTSLILLIPSAALLAGVYFLSSLIIYHGALWADAWFAGGLLPFASIAVAPALMFSPFFCGMTLIFFKKDRRKYLSELDSVVMSRRKSGCLSVVACVSTAIVVMFVLILSNSFAAFYPDGVRLPVQESMISADNYAYPDIEKLVLAEGVYDENGNFTQSEQYILILKNGTKYYLSFEVTNAIIKEKIVP